jgi:heme exporter protein B
MNRALPQRDGEALLQRDQELTPRDGQGLMQRDGQGLAQRDGQGLAQRDGMGSVFASLLQRDLLLAVRRRSDVGTTFFFFIIVVSLFPLGVGPEPDTLRSIAPGVVWVAALLASMLALGRLFAGDYADGTLEQMALSPQPLLVLVLAKVLAHWLVTGLPLVLIAPVLGLQFDLSAGALVVMTLGLLLGTPVLSMIGAVGAALTLGVRGAGGLLALLVLPLYIPVLIFGAGAVSAIMGGMGAAGHLSLLGAFLLIALVFSPWAAAAAIRIALE